MLEKTKRLLSLLLVAVFIFCAVPEVFAVGAEATSVGANDPANEPDTSLLSVVDDGKVGNTVWTVYTNGLLEISGEGMTKEYSETNYAPWYAYKNSITEIIVRDTVDRISPFAFWGCNNVTQITIPFTGASESEGGPNSMFGVIFGYTTLTADSNISWETGNNYASTEYAYFFFTNPIGGNVVFSEVDSEEKSLNGYRTKGYTYPLTPYYQEYYQSGDRHYRLLFNYPKYSGVRNFPIKYTNSIDMYVGNGEGSWYSCYDYEKVYFHRYEDAVIHTGNYWLRTYYYSIPATLRKVIVTSGDAVHEDFRGCDSLDIVGLQHTYGDWKKYTPTQHKRICPCGDIEYADHTWNNGETTKQATHLSVGTNTYSCTLCGQSKSETIPKIEEHEFSTWSFYNDETHQMNCACGETINEYHAWDAGTKVVTETHLTCGSVLFTCQVCGGTKAQEIDKLPYHTYGEWEECDDTCHQKKCVCGDAVYDAHDWNEGVITKNPTKYEEGETTYTCQVCHATKVKAIPAIEIPASAPQISSDSITTTAGEEIEIPITFKNNKGFSYLSIRIQYSGEVFTYVSSVNGEVMSSMSSSDSKNPLKLVWVDGQDSTTNGTLAILKLKISEDAAADDYTISISVVECYDAEEKDVIVYSEQVTVSVISFVYGDVNGDGVINGKDATRLTRYLANYDDETGTSTVEVFAGADANGDGVINGKDATRLTRYLANYDDETGKSTVELGK